MPKLKRKTKIKNEEPITAKTSCLPHNSFHGGSKRQSQAPVRRSRAVCEQKCVTRRAHDRTMLHRLGDLVARFSFFHIAMHKCFKKIKMKKCAHIKKNNTYEGKKCLVRDAETKIHKKNRPKYTLHYQCVTQKV